MNTVIIIQARVGSSRLPGKTMLPLGEEPLLLRMIERVRAAKTSKTIVVATTEEEADDQISELCITEGINIYRGHSTNLLDRHFKAALNYDPTIVVKIPSDCPLIDPGVIDKVLDFYIMNMDKYDYVSNLHPASYPDGNDVEVMTFNTLYRTWLYAGKQFELEHTTPYIWENPDKFRIGNVEWETGMNYSMTHRFTIDYIEDYMFIKAIYDELYPTNPLFSMDDILYLLEKKPELMEINRKYTGVNWYREHLNELKTITPDQTKVL
ncbi:MAG: glycosyltransferase family protein [Ignavibacteriaceae bacterium]|nr:glycosyltransferase family protein [Ignavibacteriaceae bacterium]